MFALKLLITDNTDISKEVLHYLGDDLSSVSFYSFYLLLGRSTTI